MALVCRIKLSKRRGASPVVVQPGTAATCNLQAASCLRRRVVLIPMPCRHFRWNSWNSVTCSHQLFPAGYLRDGGMVVRRTTVVPPSSVVTRGNSREAFQKAQGAGAKKEGYAARAASSRPVGHPVLRWERWERWERCR